ncbi:hypothetical protein DZB84_10200 [Bacillus sp. HNG]|uniref:ADP-dependent glucokinase/phosphofructokinase n=1 Tax=Bacillus sp. HNG TaxID=2293325 RepID=UPI000E2F93EE|nr:ADP-dependent glucokinase/phosphofructokinase [Bacillus sp. HNG]RFB17425.1 hypothetical protein DZB84_10200 [Bacillus sp. HNG]
MKSISFGFTANIDLLANVTEPFYEEIKENANGEHKPVIDTWEKFCTAVAYNIERGSGAEYIVSEQSVLSRLEKSLKWKKAIGGTGIQAGCAASRAGYFSIVNIPVISEELVSLVTDYENLKLVPKKTGEVPKHYILEYDNGITSNRIIFRKDNEFSPNMIGEPFINELLKVENNINWLLISGYNSFDSSEEITHFLKETVDVLKLMGNNRPKVHLELASIWSLDEQWKIIKTLQGYIDSIGMNEDEFQELFKLNKPLLEYEDHQLIQTIDEVYERLNVSYFILHTKQFSLVKSTRYDTSQWAISLRNGNQFAFARALTGKICDKNEIHLFSKQSSLNPRGEKLKEITNGRKDITICPSYIGRTTSTIGLGDTFTAGLLVEAPTQFNKLVKTT